MKTPLRVLIIEDSEDDAQLAVDELRRGGYEPAFERIETAAALQAALQRSPWDIVISDYRMPDFSGPAALKLVKASGLDLPFIIVSGTIGEEQAVTAIKLGAHDYLLKDRLGRLGTAVAHELENTRLRQASRQAEQQLLLHTTALETAANAVTITDAKGIILWVNPAFTALSGYAPEAVIGHTPRVLKSGKHDQAFYRELWRTILSGQTWRGEFINRRKDGSLYHGEQTITPVRAQGGAISHFIGIMNDVTARTQAEAALRESEERLRIVTNNARVGLVMVNRERCYTFANAAYAEMLGLPSADLVGQRVADVLMPLYEEQIRPRLDRAFAGERVAYELHQSALGAEGHFAVRYEPTKVDGEVALVVVVITDITERKRAEVALVHRTRLAALGADIGIALTRPGSLREVLGRCADAMVKHLDAAFARIWTLNEAEQMLELQASAGKYRHLDGPHGRVPVGKFKIGLIAQERKPHLTNSVVDDPRVSDREWARREGMVAFAGYPLVIEGHLVGVMAMFARHPLAEATLATLGSVADGIALGIERKRAEEELRQTADLLKAVADGTTDAVFVKDAEGRYLLFNEAASRFVDRPTAEVIGQDDTALFDPEGAKQVMANDRAVRESGQPQTHEERLTAAGVTRTYLATKAPYRDAQGNIIGTIGISRDITERKQLDLELRESQRRFTDMMSRVQLISLMLDREARITFANDYLLRLTGWQREEVMGRNWFELFIPPDEVGLKDVFAALIADSPAAWRHANEILTRSGGRRLIQWNNSVLRSTSGEVIGTASIGEDITERKRAEERIREQAAMLDCAHEAIIVREIHSRRITFWNQGAERLYGWTPAEAEGRDIGELIFADPRMPDVVTEEILRVDKRHGEFKHVTKAGKELIVSSHATLVREADGRPKSVLVINHDITEQKNLEAQFLRAQRLESIGSLAGGIAHDLNNALAPILMASELLKIINQDADQSRILDTIYASAKRGAGMVKQILTFARGSEGERGPVQPKHLVKEMIDIARHTFPKSIQIRTDVATDTWTLLGNPTQLHQILLNLCVNARDAMPAGGTLTLATGNVHLDAACTTLSPDAKPGPHVLLTVTDTGTGMPPEVRARIFEVFFTTKEPGKGTGLGLATVLNIARDHGGFLTVDSEVGRGTTFKVYLPAQEATDASAVEAAPPTLPMGRGELILVVDDEAGIRSICTQTLQAYGYRVVTANDGAHAVSICAQNLDELQLLITDMAMPIMDGKATARAIRTILPRLPVIVASGSDSLVGSPLLKELDVQAFLRKPFSADDLIHTVHEVLQAQTGA